MTTSATTINVQSRPSPQVWEGGGPVIPANALRDDQGNVVQDDQANIVLTD